MQGIKSKRLKRHVSWITVKDEVTLSYCTQEGCCQGLVHCPLCLPAKCPPQSSEEIEAHFKDNHLIEAVKTDDFVVMVCSLNCGVLKVPHYHCPVCGLMLKTASSMKHHLQCNCVIRKPEPIPNDHEMTSSTSPCTQKTAESEVEEARGKALTGSLNGVGGKLAGQSIWETQTKLRPNPEQRERRKMLLSQMPYAHHSMVFDVTDFDISRCGSCCSGFHCPLCPAETFTPSNPKKVLDHLEKTHIRDEVHYKGLKIMKCRLDCLPTRTRIGQSHYHCPLCPIKISIPPRFQTHIDCHERGTNKIHKRHKMGAEQSVVTEYQPVNTQSTSQLVQEAVEYRIVSGMDDGGNPVEIEVTVPTNASDAAALDSALQYLLPSGNFEIREEAVVQTEFKGQDQGYTTEEVTSDNQASESLDVLPLENEQVTSYRTETIGENDQHDGQTNYVGQMQCEAMNSEDSEHLPGEQRADETPDVTNEKETDSILKTESDASDDKTLVSVELTETDCDGAGKIQEQADVDDKFEIVNERYEEDLNKENHGVMTTESSSVVNEELEDSDDENNGEDRESEMSYSSEKEKQTHTVETVSRTTDILDEEHVSVSMTTKYLRSVGVALSELCELLAGNFSVSCTINEVQGEEKLTISGSWEKITCCRECITQVTRQKAASSDELHSVVSEYRQEVQRMSGNCREEENSVLVNGNVVEEITRNGEENEESRVTEGGDEERGVDVVSKPEVGLIVKKVGMFEGTEEGIEEAGKTRSRRSRRIRGEGKQDGKYRQMLRGSRKTYSSRDNTGANGGKMESKQRGINREEKSQDKETFRLSMSDKVESSVKKEDRESVRSGRSEAVEVSSGTKRRLGYGSDGEDCHNGNSSPVKKRKGQGIEEKASPVIDEQNEPKSDGKESVTKSQGPLVIFNPALYVQEKNVVIKEEQGSSTKDQTWGQTRLNIVESIDMTPDLSAEGLEISVSTVGREALQIVEQDSGTSLASGVSLGAGGMDVCPICKKYGGPSKEELLMHILNTACMQNCHRNKRNLPKELCTQIDRMNKCRSSVCYLCKREFSGIKQAKIHYAMMMCCKKQKKNPHNIPRHHESGLYLCELCGYEASIPNKVWQHMQRKHLQKEYQCDMCTEMFTTPRFMQVHKERVHMDTEKSVCEHCGKELFTKYMKRHYNDVHNPSYTRASRVRQQERLCCTQCHYSTLILDDLNRHVRRQHGQRNYHCHVCSATFAFQGDLNVHMKTIHGVREVVTCHLCDKQVLKKHLSLHVRNIHDNVKSFSCPVCGKGLQTKFSLKYHIETHKRPQDRQYKFKCGSCNSGFMNRSVLRDHMNCHTGNRPYLCQMCHKSFRQRSVYHQHLQIHNNVKFMCAFCGLIFASKKAVFEHKEMVHAEPQLAPRPPNVCVCGVVSDSAYMLTRHQEDCVMYLAAAQIHGTDNVNQKDLTKLDVGTRSTNAEGILDDGGNSLISPQEAAAILEQEGSEFMAREVIQLDNGTMLVIQDENKDENQPTASVNQTDSETVDNSSYLCGYCSVTCQSMDEIEQHMLTLHGGEGIEDTSGNHQLIASLSSVEAAPVVADVGQVDLENNQSEQFIQTTSQSATLIVSQTGQIQTVEQIAYADCLPVMKAEPEEPFTYQVLPSNIHS